MSQDSRFRDEYHATGGDEENEQYIRLSSEVRRGIEYFWKKRGMTDKCDYTNYARRKRKPEKE